MVNALLPDNRNNVFRLYSEKFYNERYSSSEIQNFKFNDRKMNYLVVY